jgi:Flp pilus assembly protein TadG
MNRLRWSALDGNLLPDRGGTAAIEFALVVPALLTLVMGCFEASNLILADLKLEAAAETAADLVAQTRVSTVLQSSDFTNVTNATTQVMTRSRREELSSRSLTPVSPIALVLR